MNILKIANLEIAFTFNMFLDIFLGCSDET